MESTKENSLETTPLLQSEEPVLSKGEETQLKKEEQVENNCKVMEHIENTSLLQSEKHVTKNGETSQSEHNHVLVEQNVVVNQSQAVMGFPVEHVTGGVSNYGTVQGGPALSARAWSTNLFDCCSCNEEEYSTTDMQICLLGTFAPCVLYGQNMSQLNPANSFFYHCCAYGALLGVSLAVCHTGYLAQWYAFPSRTTLREKHSLPGFGEFYSNACGCCLTRTEQNHEECDSLCDFTLHCFCHRCALCQEARELHRRQPPAYQGPSFHTTAPSKQTMD
ncbi:unnamed protein product [Calypogeia fissa]